MTEDVKIKISSDFDKKGFDALSNSLKTTSRSFKEVESSSMKAKQSFDNMSIGLQALASGAITAFVIKAANMGAELSVLRSNFIGSSKDIELFRKATAGTVDDGSLIKLSNYASDLGVNLEDQAKLFSLAEDAADKYGGTVESNFERVINASDGSAKGLRSVGISTKDFGEEVDKLTGKMGLKLDAMTADEQQNIRLQAIYNLTGTTLESVNNKTQDSKDKMDSLQVTVMNATASFGEGLVGSLNSTVETLGQLSSVTETAGIKLFTFNEIAASIGSAIGDLSPLISVFRLVSSEVQTATDKIKQFFQSASLSNPTYQFQYSNEDVIQYDKYGNPITPKGTLAENTNYTNGKNLGYNAQNSKGGGSDKVAKEIVKAAYDNLNDQMSYLFKGGTRSAYDLFSKNVSVPFLPRNVNDNLGSSISRIKTDKGFGETASNTLTDTQTLYGVISQTMSLIGISTDSFLGKLVSGFGTVLTIMESIKTVNSILNFIPGFADGGIMPGVSWVGERGKELMFNPGAYVMNHSDSMKFMNSNSSSSNVNVYLSGNIDVKAQLRKENKKYRAITIKQ